jgi:hypothetical protein
MRARPSLTLRVVPAAAVAVAVALSGCGTGASQDSIDAATKSLLQRDLRTLSQAAARRDYAAAGAALSAMNADLAAARTAGKLTDPKLAQIRAAAVKVQADLAASTPRASLTPPSSPTSTESKGHGKGNGSDHGGGGD